MMHYGPKGLLDGLNPVVIVAGIPYAFAAVLLFGAAWLAAGTTMGAVAQMTTHAKNQAQVGKTLRVLIEGTGDGLSVGRSYRDAPEIDGMVIVDGEVPPGEMVPVRISGAMAYDLSGTVDTSAAKVVGMPLELAAAS